MGLAPSSSSQLVLHTLSRKLPTEVSMSLEISRPWALMQQPHHKWNLHKSCYHLSSIQLLRDRMGTRQLAQSFRVKWMEKGGRTWRGLLPSCTSERDSENAPHSPEGEQAIFESWAGGSCPEGRSGRVLHRVLHKGLCLQSWALHLPYAFPSSHPEEGLGLPQGTHSTRVTTFMWPGAGSDGCCHMQRHKP